MNLSPRLLNLARKVVIPIASSVGFTTLGALAMILQAWLLSRAVSDAFIGGRTLTDLWSIFISLVAVVFVRGLLSFGAEYTSSRAAILVKSFLREQIFNRLFKKGLIELNRERSGELAMLSTQTVEALDAYFSQYLPQLMLCVLIPVSLLLVVFPADILSGLVLLFTAPLIPVFMILIGKGAESVTHKQFITLQRLSAQLLDSLQGITILKTLNQSKAQTAVVAETSKRYRETTMEVLRVTFLSSLVLELVGTIGTAIVAVQIGLRVLYSGMNFELAFFILLLAPEFYFPLRQLGMRFHAAASGVEAATRIFDFIDPFDKAEPVEATTLSINPSDHIEKIEFKNVAYQYSDSSDSRFRSGVQGINMVIQRGERVALIGPSGAGKSTIGHLLLRFIFPQMGDIFIDEVPLSYYSPIEWRKMVCWVPQAPQLFSGTLAENILVGRPGANTIEMREAARQACLEDWVTELPRGYNTVLGEGGLGVSGGQAQRIAIARAILKNAPVVILDEPTSHIDPILEQKVGESLKQFSDGRLMLTIAHKRSTILNSDRVYVIQQGRIVQSGKPHELASQNGMFTKLWQATGGQS